LQYRVAGWKWTREAEWCKLRCDGRKEDLRIRGGLGAALAFAGPALRTVSIETHRALGAIGYAEEHEAPRHFRRVHADLARFGGVRSARAALTDFVLGPAP